MCEFDLVFLFYGVFFFFLLEEWLCCVVMKLLSDCMWWVVESVVCCIFMFGGCDIVDVEVFFGQYVCVYMCDNCCEKWVFVGLKIWDSGECVVICDVICNILCEWELVFFDVGVNVGFYMLFVLVDVGKFDCLVWVVVVELDEENCRCLNFNFQVLYVEYVYVVLFVLGVEEKLISLIQDDCNCGEVCINDMDEDGIILMKFLLMVLEEVGVDYVDIMKMDIEGFEEFVFLVFFKMWLCEKWL